MSFRFVFYEEIDDFGECVGTTMGWGTTNVLLQTTFIFKLFYITPYIVSRQEASPQQDCAMQTLLFFQALHQIVEYMVNNCEITLG